jgi:hypothetical protein
MGKVDRAASADVMLLLAQGVMSSIRPTPPSIAKSRGEYPHRDLANAGQDAS